MMKNYKTIIWDWNGTLLNDIDICVDIANQMLKNHGNLQLNFDSYRDVFGFPITDYYKKIGIDLEKESMPDLTQKFISNYMKNVKDCRLHNNISEVLQHFQNRNIPQFILTAAHKDIVKDLTQFYSINHHFQEIEGLDNHRAESKIHRGIALLQNSQINKSDAIMIGDTDHDFEVAEAIGIDCILVANGHQSKNRLEKAGNGKVRVLDDVVEILEII